MRSIPTIRVSMRPLDMGIAGCGVAGLAIAALLARDGHRVTIFERFDAPQPVGSGLLMQPTGMAVLHELGLAEPAIARGARIVRLHGCADGRTVLDVDYSCLARPDAFAVALHRSDLFDLLFQAATAAGAAIVCGKAVTGTDARCLQLAGGARHGPFDILIDVAGGRSPLVDRPARPLAYGALWTTIERTLPNPRNTLSQRYRRAEQMAGLLPLCARRTALFWSLRADRHENFRRAGIEAWREQWRALWPETAVAADAVPSLESLTFARYAHRTLRRPVEGRLIHLGDSWHSTSPQLGQGANQALLDAFALVCALRSTNDIDDALATTVRMRRTHVRLYQTMSYWLTPVYQSDGRLIPALRDRLVGRLSSVWPVPQIQASMVSGLVGQPLAKLAFAPPSQDDGFTAYASPS